MIFLNWEFAQDERALMHFLFDHREGHHGQAAHVASMAGCPKNIYAGPESFGFVESAVEYLLVSVVWSIGKSGYRELCIGLRGCQWHRPS